MATKKREWSIIDTGDGTTKIVCYPSEANDCFVVGLTPNGSYGLLTAKNLSFFHDESLAKATAEINTILQRVARENGNPTRHLHLLDTGKGLFLAWVFEVSDRQEQVTGTERLLGLE